MNNGFSILEVLVALALSLGILSIVITNITNSTVMSKKITSNQQVLESIFHTVDMLKTDLTHCGMRLQEVNRFFNIPLFEHTDNSFRVVYGSASEKIDSDLTKGSKILPGQQNDYFQKGKKILIYNVDSGVFEYNRIAGVTKNNLTLDHSLQNEYKPNTFLVVLKEIEYKLYSKQQVLKRKVNKGYFQPMIENITDFYIKFFPESLSVLYRIEVNQKEQIRGYIFLTNMVHQ